MCIQFCSDNNNNNKVTLAALYTCTEYSVFTMIIIMITKEFYYIPNSIHIYLIINYTYIDNKIRLIRWEIGREPWGTLLPRRVCKASFEPCLGTWDIGRELRETLLPRRVCEARILSPRECPRESLPILRDTENPRECPRESLPFRRTLGTQGIAHGTVETLGTHGRAIDPWEVEAFGNPGSLGELNLIPYT